jgi:predicted outer membrane repeat protein
MKYKSIIILALTIFVLISIAGVSAADTNDTAIASEDTGEIELSANSIETDGLKTSPEDTPLSQANNDEIINVENDVDVLGEGEYDYTQLKDHFRFDGDISLTAGNYTYVSGDGDTIEITTSRVIDGNGAVIDMANSGHRAFYITASDVTIKNLTIKNANFNGNGGAIYFSSSGTVTNCNFINNKATADNSYGGAVWMYSGSVENCNFIDNSAVEGGGAMFSGVAINSTFIYNHAACGAAIFDSDAINCTFINNHGTIINYGMTDGDAIKCNFIGTTITVGSYVDCTFSDTGTLIASDFVTVYGSGERFMFTLNNGEGDQLDGVHTNVTIKNSEYEKSFFALTGEGFVVDLPLGVYEVSLSYYGSDDIIPTKTVKLAVTDGTTFFDLDKKINGNTNSTITLDKNYTYNSAIDSTFTGGIVINRPVTIIGNGYIIDANGKTRIFQITSDNVVLENITFVNGNTTGNGGAVYFSQSGRTINCNFINNKATADFSYGGAIYMSSGSVTNCNFADNTATSLGGAIRMTSGSIENCNFTDNKVTGDDSYGGAIYFGEHSTGSVINCSFTNNKATGDYSYGGAIWFTGEGTVKNCNFTNNTADRSGGAVYFYWEGTVSNCNFTDNQASSNGGAIWIYFGNVTNCNFINNTATNGVGGAINMCSGTVTNCSFTNNSATKNGGAIYFDEGSTGRIINCNFTDNKVTGDDSYGGAIYFGEHSTGSVINCNFTNNKATGDYSYGGAIDFKGTGNITNCSFIGNNAYNGGAVRFFNSGSITNCNFSGNKANCYGGAVCFIDNCEVTYCNFINNSARYGGAVYFLKNGEVTNSNFTNNSASYGGAIRFQSDGTVENCNFTGNNATTGSAIYFFSTSDTKSVSNSRFLNNRANAETLEVTKNDNNITISFTGNDNLLNAIYSEGDVTFTNVAYWGANVIANTGSSPTTPTRSNKEAGQNITVSIVVNDEIVLNNVYLTDENGMIVLDIKAGENYYITARHDTDSYYTEAEKTISTMKFNVNVTSQTTNNKTVNITAKSNIPNEVIDGKLLFIVPNTDPINATYAGNGTWWAVYTFDNAGDYNVNASYIGLDNVTINNATISIRFDASVEVNNKTLDLLIGDTFTVVATTTPEGLKVSFVPDDSGVYSIDENGNVIALRDGEGSILIKVGGDGTYAENSTTINVIVNRIKTELAANDVTATYNINSELIITLKDSNGKVLSGVRLTVDLNGIREYVTDANGQVSVSTKGLVPNAYVAKITFAGNAIYKESSANVNVAVKKATPKIIAKKKTYKAKAKTKKFTITLKDNTGKPIKKVKVRLMVKKITKKTKKTKTKSKKKKKKNIVKTNKKGKATFKIDRNKKGKYWATVKFYGNKYYTPVTKKVKITIK